MAATLADPSPTTPALAWPTWLVAQREQRGWTQAVLADKVSCSPRTIGALERGERAPSRDMAEDFFALFHTPDADQALLVAPLALRRGRPPKAPGGPAPGPPPPAHPDPPPVPAPDADGPPPSHVEGPPDLTAFLDARFAAQARAWRAWGRRQRARQIRWLSEALIEERHLVRKEQREWDVYRDQRRAGGRAAWVYGLITVGLGYQLGLSPTPVMFGLVGVLEALNVWLVGGPWIELQMAEGRSRLRALLILIAWGLIGIGLVALTVFASRAELGGRP